VSQRQELAAALAPREPRPTYVEPRFRQTVDEPWKQADAYAFVDRRSGGFCECKGADADAGCGLRANVHHHIAGRGGANPHHPDNLLHLNDAHHRWIHDHPEESYANGTMRRRVR